jgi:AcrR family transcriptional regulator
MTENSAFNQTRHRLLECACRIFAEKGFYKATIAEICREADANVASVNYHFGSKRKLYDKAWRHAFLIASETFSLDRGLSEKATQKERLQAFISSFLHRLLEEGPPSYFTRMISREMAEPTPSFPAIHEEALMPTRQYLFDIVQALLGEAATEEKAFRCTYSIMSQCLFLLHHTPMREKMLKKKRRTFEEIDIMSEYLTCFCLGGIMAVREV